ncbi:MAG: trypsin-like serine protease [Actinomycetota bacterium]
MQEAAVPIYGDPYCDSVNGGLFEAATMICAGDLANGIDTCFGDSGGPLALSVGGVKTLVGDTSWGPEPCANPIRPGVYGRISAFRPWLAEQLRPTPPAPTITAVTSTGPSLAVTWAEPGGTTAWSALSFEASDGLTSTTVEAPLLGASLSRATGGTLTITVTARNPAQSSSTAWSGVPTPTRAPVVSATLPAKPAAGTELTATAASDDPWGGAIAYQWLLDGADIPGASAAAYRPTAAQAGRLLSLRVAAANAAGTGTATVEAGRVLRAPQVRAGRVPVRGRAVVGGRLTAAAPSATGYPRPRVTYRFARNGRVVQTGRARVYRVRERDRGAVITGTVTWTSSAGAVVRKLTAVRIAR